MLLFAKIFLFKFNSKKLIRKLDEISSKVKKEIGQPIKSNQLLEKFRELKVKTHVPSCQLYISNINELNAFSWNTLNIITITKKDIDELSLNNLEALISHELYHIYHYRKYKSGSKLLVRIHSFLISIEECIFFYLPTIILGYIVIDFFIYFAGLYNLKIALLCILFAVIAIIALVLIYLIILSYNSFYLFFKEKYQGKRADIFGAKLVGKKQMIKLLKRMNKLTKLRDTKNEIMILKLKYCPIACLKCLFQFFLYKAMRVITTIGLNIHETYNKRIKNIKNCK